MPSLSPISNLRSTSMSCANYNMVCSSAAITLLFAAALLADGTHAAVVVGSTGCECLGISRPDAGEGNFADNYGKRCAAHDILTGGTLWPTYEPGEWNCQSWCYVDPETCDSALPSWQEGIELHYSYDACEDHPSLVGDAGNCPWTGQQIETNVDWSSVTTFNPCTCAGVSHADTDTFGEGYGSHCQPWELNICGTLWPSEEMGSWCCDKWCYVHEACPLSYQGWDDKTKYWSYDFCEEHLAFEESCPWTAESPMGQPLPFAPGYEGCDLVMSYSDFHMTPGSKDTMNMCNGGKRRRKLMMM